MEKKLKSNKENCVYICKFCGKPCSSFECDCQKKLKYQKLWTSNPRRKLERIKLKDSVPKNKEIFKS